MVVGSLHQLLKLLNVLVKTRQQFLSAPDFLEHTCDVLVCPRLPHERRVANPVTLNDAVIILWPAVVVQVVESPRCIPVPSASSHSQVLSMMWSHCCEDRTLGTTAYPLSFKSWIHDGDLFPMFISLLVDELLKKESMDD